MRIHEWPNLTEMVGEEEALRLIDAGLEELRECFANLLITLVQQEATDVRAIQKGAE